MKRQRSTYNLSFRSVLSAIAGRLCTHPASAQERSNRGILMPLLTLGFLLSAFSGVSRADQYWVAWEGNDFPENEGWLREGDGSRPMRTLSDGIMTLDSLASEESEDFYGIYGIPDPGAGEEFVAQWRLRVNQVDWDNPNFPYDPGWAIYSDSGWQAVFVIGVSEFHHLESQQDVQFEAGAFHTWEFRSSNMRAFAISLDGVPVLTGGFVPTTQAGRVSWGDLVSGPTSHFDNDYFRFGVVPEPRMGMSMLTLTLMFRSRRQR